MAITHPSDIPGLRIRLHPHTEAYEDSAGAIPATVGNPVGNVPDQTGVEDPVVQDNTALKPTLQVDANGWRYLQYDGDDDELFQATLDIGEQPFTAVLVFLVDVDAVVTNNVIAASGGNQQILNDRGGGYQVYFGSNYRRGTPQRGTRLTAVIRLNGALSELFIDGVSQGVADAGSEAWSPGLRWGGLGSNYLLGRAYELLVYEGELTNQQVSDLSDLLVSTYSNPAPGGGTTVEAALTLGQISLSGAAEREAALSAALTLSALAASGQVAREADLSGALTLAGLSVQGTLGQTAGIEGALTLGALALSGQLDREAQLTAALTLGQLSLQGQIAREADLTGSLTLGPLGITGTIGTPALDVSGSLTLGSLQTQGQVNVQIALSAALTLAQLGAGGSVEREAAMQAALTLGALRVQGVLGEQPQLRTLEVTLTDAFSLDVSLTDVFTLETQLTD